MSLREAAQQALEALEHGWIEKSDDVVVALRAALEQHEKDVEWMKQRHANWRLQKELAEQTQERDRQQREYEEARSAALEQPEQEPVAWMVYTQDGKSVCVTDNPADFIEWRSFPLYTHPPRREWRGLTEEEINEATFHPDGCMNTHIEFARAIEAALRSKNHETPIQI